MNGDIFPALVGAAFALGLLHSLAPDHWVPFAALGQARDWTPARTAAVTLLCGLGHVGVSVGLGVAAVGFGGRALEALGTRMESLAGWLLIAFGVAYGLWGLHHATAHHLPGLGAERDAGHFPVTTLFVVFAFDPCLPLIPLLAAAAPLGWTKAAAVGATYAAATLATMVSLAVPARLGARAVRGAWFERWGHAAAGALILLVGMAVGVLGI